MPAIEFRRMVSSSVLGTVLLAASLLGTARAADAPPTPAGTIVSLSARQSGVVLTETESRILSTKARIKTVDGFDDKVLKVTSTDKPNEIRILGLATGLTNLILVDENGETFNVEVLVGGDVKHLEALIRRTFPDSSVQATMIKSQGAVLLTGWVNQPGQLTMIVSIAEQFSPKVLNHLQVSGIQTVMLRVKIMEVQRGRIRNLGFNFLHLQNGHFLTSSVGALAPLAALGAPALGTAASPALSGTSATATFGVVSNSEVFQGFVEALKQESLLKILAEPNLIAVSGRPSNFLSGGEFPILVPGGLGTVTVQFKPFGVKLEFVPQMEGNGRVRLDVATEVSEKDFSNTVTVGTTIVPGLTTRRANAQLDMAFGETLVIAGLISNRVQARTQKIPFLGELPWIGSAFRRVSHDESETELLIIVTPDLAAPMDENSLPQGGPGANTVTPTDRELYGQGLMEVKKYGPDPILDLYEDGPATIQPMGYFQGSDARTPTGVFPGDENQLPPLPPEAAGGVRRGSTRPLVSPQPRGANGQSPGLEYDERTDLEGQSTRNRSTAPRSGVATTTRKPIFATNASRSRPRSPAATRPGLVGPRTAPGRPAYSEGSAPPGLIEPDSGSR